MAGAGKKPRRWSTCVRKVRFATERDATAVLRTMLSLTDQPDRLHAYPCKFCDGWHLGHLIEERIPPKKSRPKSKRGVFTPYRYT